jgi:hypothetical protein
MPKDSVPQRLEPALGFLDVHDVIAEGEGVEKQVFDSVLFSHQFYIL